MRVTTLHVLAGGLLLVAVFAACRAGERGPSQLAQAATPTPDHTPIPTASTYPQPTLPRIPARLQLEGETLQTLAVSPDGYFLVVGTRSGIYMYETDSFHPLWFGAVTRPVMALDFSPSGQVLAVGSIDGLVTLWETRTGIMLEQLPRQGGSITSLDWSPDGSLLAIGAGHKLLFWNAAVRSMRHPLEGHSELVRAVAFSPDGSLIASGADDRVARVWDSRAGISLAVIEHRHPVTALAWRVFGGANDDWLLATGTSGGTIALSEIRRDGRLLRPLYEWRGHRFEITGLHYAADQDRLLSVGRDGRIAIWDIVAGERLLAFRAHDTWAMGAVWAEGDTKVVSGGWDGEIVRWDVGE